MLQAKIARYGNSLTLRLPAALARDLDLHEGDSVALRRVDDGFVLQRSPRARLRARLATVRTREPEIGVGRALGEEDME